MTPCSFFLPINNLSVHMELRIGHLYFLGEMSGTTTISLEHLHLRNLRRGLIRINGGKHNNFAPLIIFVQKRLLPKIQKRGGEKRMEASPHFYPS